MRRDFFRNALAGLLMGIGCVLPGVSGGVMAVTATLPENTVCRAEITPCVGASGGTAQIIYAGVYAGSYSPRTLPPYQQRGYAEELLACKRYFAIASKVGTYAAAGSANTNTVHFYVPIGAAMRVTPTPSPASGVSLSVRWNGGAYNATDGSLTVWGADNSGVQLRVSSASAIINAAYASAIVVLGTPISLSADL